MQPRRGDIFHYRRRHHPAQLQLGVFLRTGPLEMVRDGVLILRLHTDQNGKLQGQFSSWDDAGVLTESGHYVDGLKHGEWLVTDANGERRVEHYRAGVVIAP